MEDHRFLFMVVPVGNAGVGKTSSVRRYTGEKYWLQKTCI
jgi:GTPase SAR1 family protein